MKIEKQLVIDEIDKLLNSWRDEEDVLPHESLMDMKTKILHLKDTDKIICIRCDKVLRCDRTKRNRVCTSCEAFYKIK